MTSRRNKAAAGDDLAALEKALGHRFADRELLVRALVHGSAATEGDLQSNQTLEFLGDAVLDLAVSDALLRSHPDAGEGDLTRMRATIVSARGVADAAARFDVGRWIRLGKGEARAGGGQKPSILADTCEALLGAVFLDAGYDVAREVVARLFAFAIAGADPSGDDPKTELQELTQRLYRCTPSYVLLATSGPDHARHFEVAIRLNGEELSRGEGASRKGSEQLAAKRALEVLRERKALGQTPVAAPPPPSPESAPPPPKPKRARATRTAKPGDVPVAGEGAMTGTAKAATTATTGRATKTAPTKADAAGAAALPAATDAAKPAAPRAARKALPRETATVKTPTARTKKAATDAAGSVRRRAATARSSSE